jgi:glycosyltransferase involved in cell wall biosynthesis
MANILVVSLNYAPEETGIAPYSTGLAEHLASRGYGATVVAGMPHYPAWHVDAAYAHGVPNIEHRNGVTVRRARHYVPSAPSPVRRALYEASSLAMALPAAHSAPPDAVLGVVPSLSGGLVARAAAMRFQAPYGLIFQDLIGPATAQSGIGADAGVSMAARFAEGVAARGAAAVGVVAEGFRPYVGRLGVDPARIRRVRNWSRGADATVRRGDMRLLLGWPSDAVVCLHAGNMGAKQGLENVVAAAKLATLRDRRLLFVLMGDGNQRAALERLAAEHALPNLRFLPLQSEAIFPSVLRAADLLLINQRASVTDMALPSKLTAYFASGRPVVAAAAADSETARELRGSSAGIVAPPDEPRALLDAIARVANDAGLATYLGARGEAYACNELSKESALQSYEQVLACVLAAGKRGRVILPAPLRSNRSTGRAGLVATGDLEIDEPRDRLAA